MALLWIDGFDHYRTGNQQFLPPYAVGAYDHFQGTIGAACGIGDMPELGGYGFMTISTSGSHNLRSRLEKNLPRPYGSGDLLGVGFHVYPNSSSGGLACFRNDTFSNGDPEGFRIRQNAGALQILRHFSTEVASGGVLVEGILSHVEWQIYLHSTAGWVEARINGQTVIREDGLNTLIGGDMNIFGLSPGRDGAIGYIDNLYIYDGTGDVNNDWLGERNVFTLRPDADTATEEWSLSSGSDSFSLINQTPSDPENDYLEASEVDLRSVFGASNLPSAEISIVGVQVNTQAYKTGTSDTELTHGLVTNSVEASTTTSLIQDQATWDGFVIENNPDTTAPWGPGEIDSIETFIERSL